MKCLIVDDDPVVCDTVEEFLRRVGGIDYCLKVGDGATALQLIAAEPFDAVFLDLDLPGIDGVSLLGSLPTRAPVVVISASDDFGAQSYDFGVVDYLVKPLAFPRFAKAVARLRSQAPPAPQAPAPAAMAQAGPGEIFLREGARIQRIDLERVLYVKAESNYASFVFADGKSVMSLVSMRRLEDLLPQDFVRIHRSYLVRRQQISQIEGSNAVVGGRRLPIGQSYRAALVDKLGVIN
ncbi:LytTR family DNA-binding domain-containing protein [soil metagenome]